MQINELFIWLIQFSPIIGGVVILCLATHRKNLSPFIGSISVFISWIFSCWLLISSIAEEGSLFISTQHEWFSAFNLNINIGVMSDGLTAMMCVVVTSVALLVEIFSKGYMEHEDGIARYYVFLSIFIFSMLGAVLAVNLLQVFIFWELMGLCSFLLIGFWFEKPQAVRAARKAFLITRLGDLGFVVALVVIWNAVGTLDISVINESAAQFSSVAIFVATFGLLCGAMGKSAQFPLHVWLPDAMEGPTPVSALIHAATMVAAGVFLIARFFPLFELSGDVQSIMLYIGLITLLLTGFLGMASNDIKRVLAYSTVSQLGYMFVGLGLGAYVAAIFHLITHAFFKALLFLCSGSINHSTDTFDMRNMGGLYKLMPYTFLSFLIGSLALCGLFPFAGFWSKEAIIGVAYEKNVYVFALLMLGVLLTSFYVFRALILTFFGEFRPSKSFKDKDMQVHESAPIMTAPLVILSIPAIFIGFIHFAHLFEEMLLHANPYLDKTHLEHHFHLFIPILSTFLIAGGALLAYFLFYKKAMSNLKKLINNSFLVKTLDKRYYIDYLIEQVFVSRLLLQNLGNSLVYFDKNIIDKIVNGFGRSSISVGRIFVRSFNGEIQFYSFVMILGLLACQIIIFVISYYVLGS